MSEETWEKVKGELNNYLHGAHTGSASNAKAAIDAHEADLAGNKPPKRASRAKAVDKDAA